MTERPFLPWWRGVQASVRARYRMIDEMREHTWEAQRLAAEGQKRQALAELTKAEKLKDWLWPSSRRR